MKRIAGSENPGGDRWERRHVLRSGRLAATAVLACCFGAFLLLDGSIDYPRDVTQRSLSAGAAGDDDGAEKVDINKNIAHATATFSEPNEKESLLHCYREGPNSNSADAKMPNLLITGCGYSSTGFFAKTFTSAGYPLGHERILQYGNSDWLTASRRYHLRTRNDLVGISPMHYRHVMLLVRHPLKVVNSQYGTHWNFEYEGIEIRNEVILFPHVFDSLQTEFKSLGWWIAFTMNGEKLSECYMRNEDISVELLNDICVRAEFQDCMTRNWTMAIESNTGYNAHQPRSSNLVPVTWDLLEKKASNNENELYILRHARKLCKRFRYDDC